MTDHPRPGQIYRAARLGQPARIRLTEVSATSAAAVDHASGQALPRRIPLARLHTTPVTATGRRRGSGWVLERDATT
jgi:hypothetical protein